jgi:hypothetical protein
MEWSSRSLDRLERRLNGGSQPPGPSRPEAGHAHEGAVGSVPLVLAAFMAALVAWTHWNADPRASDLACRYV